MAATFRWDDPFRTGFAGTYDPGTMYGLYFRARGGDAAAKNHLAQAGFFDQYGNDIYGAGNNYLQATDAWAKAKNLGVYRGESPFQWDSSWYAPGAANAAPAFNNAWDSFWNKQAPNPTAPTAPQTPRPPTHNPNDENYWNQYYDAVPQGGWGRPLKAGTFLTFDGAVIPVDYDPSQDNAKWGVNGTQETAMRRAIRWATDMLRAGEASNFQNALSFAMARLGGDYLRAKATGSTVPGDRDGVAWNGGLGWDASKLRYVAYREKYNDAIDYSKPTVRYQPGVNDRAFDEQGRPLLPGAPGTPSQQNQPSAPGVPPAVPNATPGLANPTVAAAANQQNNGAFNTQPGQLTAVQKMALGADPQQAYRWMLQQIGVNPDMPGMLGNFLQKRFQPLLEARLATAGLQGGGNDAAYLDRIDEVIRNFGTSFTDKSQGGNFFQGLQTMANDALQQGGGFLDMLKDQGQSQQYLNQLASLRFAGVNPLIQQAMADQLSTAQNLYNDASFNDITFNDPYQQWLRRQEKYRSIFGF